MPNSEMSFEFPRCRSSVSSRMQGRILPSSCQMKSINFRSVLLIEKLSILLVALEIRYSKSSKSGNNTDLLWFQNSTYCVTTGSTSSLKVSMESLSFVQKFFNWKFFDFFSLHQNLDSPKIWKSFLFSFILLFKLVFLGHCRLHFYQ